MVGWINRELPVILVRACEFRSLLVRARFRLRLVFGRTNMGATIFTQLLLDVNHRLQFQSELSNQPSSSQDALDRSIHWEQIKEAAYSTATAPQDFRPYELQKLWISWTAIALLDVRRSACYLEPAKVIQERIQCISHQELQWPNNHSATNHGTQAHLQIHDLRLSRSKSSVEDMQFLGVASH